MEFMEKLLDGVEVEWKRLGELEDMGFVKLGRGNVISKTDLASTPGGFPVYSSSALNNGEFGRYGKYIFDDERITWSVDGGGRFFYREAHKYSVTNVCGWMKVHKQDELNTRFLYYVLSGAWEGKVFDYTKKAHPSVIRDEYEIPIPCPENPKKSLEIQAEIVRILDAFTAMTAELTAELNLRKKQYNYYRDQLLSAENEGVEWKTLEHLCTSISAGGDVPKNSSKGQTAPTDEYPYPIYANATGEKALYGFTDDYKIDSDAVTISARGAKVGYHTVREAKFTPIIRLIVLIANKNIVSTRYLNYVLDMTPIGGTEAGIPQLTVPMVKKLTVPIPFPNDVEKSLKEQARIVAILDKFDALTNSITEGLPREIELRQKQYEYYRDLLLSFPKPEAG